MNQKNQIINQASEANLHAVDYWQIIKNRYGVIILAFLLILMTAGIITYVIPKKYKSSAIVQVHPTVAQMNVFSSNIGQTNNGAIMTRNFFATEFEIIKAELTLKKAAEALNLPATWGYTEEQTIGVLKGITKINPVRGTDLIEIAVEYSNKDECKEIAEAVANAYKDRREEMELSRSEGALDALDSELQEQEDRVQEKRSLLNTIVQATGQTYRDGSQSNSNVGDIEDQIYNNSRLRIEELDKSKITLESQIKTLIAKSDEQLIKSAAGLDLPTSRVPQLYERFEQFDQELAALLASGLGRNHPKIKGLQASQSEIKNDLVIAVSELRDTLSSQLELVTAQITELDKQLSQQKDTAVDKALQSYDFAEARRTYETEKGLYESMKLQHSASRISLKMPKNPITIHEYPKTPGAAFWPNVKLNFVIGGILGLVLGIALAIFLEFIDTSVKSLDDVEKYLQVPVLAVIPKDIAVLHKQGGNSPDAEAYRILRTNIEFNRKNPDDNAITVVSGGAGEGKSTTLVNLAYVCAQGGYTTLIIDADLRRPRLHTFFDINNSVGLSNYLTTDLMLEDVILQTPVDNLYFLPSGVLPNDAAGVLNSRRMSELIHDVKQRFDLVLIDSPPILGVSDASVISSEADQTMIVVQHRKLPRNMLMRVKQAVESVGGDIIGVVLNNVDIRSDSQYQYYTSYYTYYAPAEDDSSVASVEPKKQKSKQPSKPTKNEESIY